MKKSFLVVLQNLILILRTFLCYFIFPFETVFRFM